MEWIEITSDYAGLFFRVLGKGSESFGAAQAENSPKLTKVNRVMRLTALDETTVFGDGTASTGVSSGATGGALHWGLSFTLSNGEVRPRNTAIRIWKRV